jgi:hypothetical protein
MKLPSEEWLFERGFEFAIGILTLIVIGAVAGLLFSLGMCLWYYFLTTILLVVVIPAAIAFLCLLGHISRYRTDVKTCYQCKETYTNFFNGHFHKRRCLPTLVNKTY